MTIEEVNAIIDGINSGNNAGFFPWEDVFASMRERHMFVGYNSEKCPRFGQSLLELYFRSPDWTWRNLMGRAGTMTICPHCSTQNSFDCTMMN